MRLRARRARRLVRATVGGLGLTGADRAARRCSCGGSPAPGWTRETRRRSKRWTNSSRCRRAPSPTHEYTVAWIDCARPAAGARRAASPALATTPRRPSRAPRQRQRCGVPLTPPLTLVNRLTLRAFNAPYYRRATRDASGASRQDYRALLLSARRPAATGTGMYGPRGFHQHQCVVPERCQRTLARCCARSAASRQRLVPGGAEDVRHRAPAGLLSFPMAGTTLALDFPNRRRGRSRLFARLDAIVAEAGGRHLSSEGCAHERRRCSALGYPRLATSSSRYRDPGVSSDDGAAAARCLRTTHAAERIARSSAPPRRSPTPSPGACSRAARALFLVGRREPRAGGQRRRPARARRRERSAARLLDANDHRTTRRRCWPPPGPRFGGFDAVLLAHGALPDQARCERRSPRRCASFDTNAHSVIALLTLLANRLEAQGAA